MKAYTDLEQSKKLAEILPIESADMKFPYFGDGQYGTTPYVGEPIEFSGGKDIHCWSLAALLEEIPDTVITSVGEDLKLHIDKDNLQYSLFYENEYTGDMFEIETELYDNMIDACYEMIIKLHEEKLL